MVECRRKPNWARFFFFKSKYLFMFWKKNGFHFYGKITKIFYSINPNFISKKFRNLLYRISIFAIMKAAIKRSHYSSVTHVICFIAENPFFIFFKFKFKYVLLSGHRIPHLSIIAFIINSTGR